VCREVLTRMFPISLSLAERINLGVQIQVCVTQISISGLILESKYSLGAFMLDTVGEEIVRNETGIMTEIHSISISTIFLNEKSPFSIAFLRREIFMKQPGRLLNGTFQNL